MPCILFQQLFRVTNPHAWCPLLLSLTPRLQHSSNRDHQNRLLHCVAILLISNKVQPSVTAWLASDTGHHFYQLVDIASVVHTPIMCQSAYNVKPWSLHTLQAHRSGMVLAIGANSGIVTCGIFGSIMWWPEAELRSSFEAAGLSLPREEQSQGSPNTNMSKLLRRYFTPSSAALAQATLQQMHSSGRLQGAESVSRPSALLEESMDLDAQPEPSVEEGVQEDDEPMRAGPPPVSGQEQQQTQQQQQQQLSHQQLQQHQQQQQPGKGIRTVLSCEVAALLTG